MDSYHKKTWVERLRALMPFSDIQERKLDIIREYLELETRIDSGESEHFDLFIKLREKIQALI